MMRFGDFDVPFGAEALRGLLNERREQVHAEAEIAGAHDGDALGVLGDFALLDRL